MRIKEYTFTAEELLLLRDAVADLVVEQRKHVEAREQTPEGASEGARRRLEVGVSLLEQFKDDCFKL